MRVALVGTGRMAAHYATILAQRSDTTLAAVCGTLEHAERLANKHSVPGFARGEVVRMLGEVPRLDAVVIATAEWDHLAPALAVAEAKFPFLLEKPIASSLADAFRIADTCTRTGVSGMMCFTQRFDDRLLAARTHATSGRLGRIGYFYSRRNADSSAARRVDGKLRMPFWILGHDIDLLRWFTGREVVEVQALTDPTDSFLHVAMRLDDGTRALVESSWLAPTSGTAYARLDVHGSDGILELDLVDRALQVSNGNGATSVDTRERITGTVPAAGASVTLIDAFLQSVRTNGPMSPSLEDGLAAALVCETVCKSMATRRWEPVTTDQIASR